MNGSKLAVDVEYFNLTADYWREVKPYTYTDVLLFMNLGILLGSWGAEGE